MVLKSRWRNAFLRAAVSSGEILEGSGRRIRRRY